MSDKRNEKLMSLYNRYWENEEIDIDLANRLVGAVPALIKENERLKEEYDECRSDAMQLYREKERLCKAIDTIASYDGVLDIYDAAKVAKQALEGLK